MEFPDFADFVGQLDIKAVDALARNLVPEAQTMILYPKEDSESQSTAFNLRIQRAQAMSLARSIALLNLYHEWLRAQNGSD